MTYVYVGMTLSDITVLSCSMYLSETTCMHTGYLIEKNVETKKKKMEEKKSRDSVLFFFASGSNKTVKKSNTTLNSTKKNPYRQKKEK